MEGFLNLFSLLLQPDLEFVLLDHASVFAHPRIVLNFLQTRDDFFASF